MRILLLNRYAQRGASSRLRTLQYIPYLEKFGATVESVPLFDLNYIDNIHATDDWLKGRFRSTPHIVEGFVRRIGALLQARRYDVIWLEKELFPYMPGIFEGMLKRLNVPYVVDYDDAIFHRYDQARSAIVRRLLSRKLYPLLNGAFAVIAGNDYLADYARRHGASRVEIIPTVLDITRYRLSPEPDDVVLRIGWIGSPSTAPYLKLLSAPLQAMAKVRPTILVTIGAPPLRIPGVTIEQHDWSIDTEVLLVESFHVGVMPLLDTAWERGKCGYKLLQYMACGRPVAASPVGVNRQIVNNRTGYLAKGDDEWLAAFQRLAGSPQQRTAMGTIGREWVEHGYTLRTMAPRVAEVLMAAGGAVSSTRNALSTMYFNL